jgi:predicted TIM-barrel fold metal-dependent hydrolase
MKTIDIHTHLLNPAVRFDRLYDKISVRFFAKGLGTEPALLRANPYETYVQTMAASIRDSKIVEKACLFGVDAVFDEQGREIERNKTVCAMNQDVLDVAERYPDQFIPFFSINPRRQNALELIDEQVEKGCKGAKFLQNYWGVDLNDERWIPYYEKLKQHDLPLIIHIGSEYSISSHPAYERVDMLNLPLATGLKVIAAHMGLGRINHKLRVWNNLSKNPRYFDSDYYRLLEMLEIHPNLYADISAILAPLRARALRHLSQQSSVHHKILFGTDYPVPFTVRYNTYDLTTEKRQEICLINNPFDRYAAVMMEYFPQHSPIYDNHKKLIRSQTVSKW